MSKPGKGEKKKNVAKAGGSKKKAPAKKAKPRRQGAAVAATASAKSTQLPSHKIRKFALAIMKLNKELTLDQSKNGFSIRHPKSKRMVIGVIGTPTTLRIASYEFTEKDHGCAVDKKGYPHIILENPNEEEVRTLGARVLKRLKIKVDKIAA